MGFWEKKKKVQVIFPNGECRRFSTPMTVRDLLFQYSHHYCVPQGPGSSLSIDDELHGGNTYLLLPLPSRLVPSNNRTPDWRPSYGIDQSLKRSGTWTPSLQRILSNATLMLSPNRESRKYQKLVKSATVKPKSPLYHNTWHTESPMRMAFMGPPGFLCVE